MVGKMKKDDVGTPLMKMNAKKKLSLETGHT